MEDTSIADPNFESEISLYGIFDGHGGKEVAEFCERNFAIELKKNL